MLRRNTSITDNDWIRYFATRAGRAPSILDVTVYKVSASQVHNSLIIVSLRADNDNPPMIIVIMTREETRKPPNLLMTPRRASRSSPRGGSNEFSGAIIRGLIRRDECAQAPF